MSDANRAFNPGKGSANDKPLQGFISTLSLVTPALSLRSNTGLKLANAFGVLKLNHYPSLAAILRGRQSRYHVNRYLRTAENRLKDFIDTGRLGYG